MDKAPSVNPKLRSLVFWDTAQVQGEDPTGVDWNTTAAEVVQLPMGELDL